MITVSPLEPPVELVEEWKKKYVGSNLVKITLFNNYFVITSVSKKEYDDIATKLGQDIDIDKLKEEIIKKATIYPADMEYIVTKGDYPVGFLDNLYEKIMYASGLGVPENIEFITHVPSELTEEVRNSLKGKYKGSTLVAIKTPVGDFVIKSLTASEFYEVKKIVNEVKKTKPAATDLELQSAMDEDIIKRCLIFPEKYYDDYIKGNVPAGIMNLISDYILRASGWAEPEIEVIE